MVKLPPEILDRPAQEGARFLALSQLEEAATAAERLRDPDVPEALHDFRVALRRIRSSLRAYRPQLKGTAPKKHRSALKRLASSTNVARDREVQIAWLNDIREQLRDTQKIGHDWLVQRLTSEDTTAALQVADVYEQFHRVRGALGRKLSRWKRTIDTKQTAREPTFRSVTGHRVREYGRVLGSDLAKIGSPEDNDRAHVARISAKRLRYLMEPISGAVREAAPLIKKLKKLQDLLGDLHDTNLLGDEIGSALEAAALERARRLHQQTFAAEADHRKQTIEPPEQAGLMQLARRLRERRRGLYSELESHWIGDRAEEFLGEVDELGLRLSSSDTGVSTERCYLLRRLPESVRDASSSLIEDGYLPSHRIRERVRRVRTEAGLRYYRLVEDPITTTRLEEEIPHRTFQSLWKLTPKRRLKKKRFTISEDHRRWRIDLYEKTNLILARVGGTTDDTAQTPLPPWIESCVVREVTGVPDYEDEALLARRVPPPELDGSHQPAPTRGQKDRRSRKIGPEDTQHGVSDRP